MATSLQTASPLSWQVPKGSVHPKKGGGGGEAGEGERGRGCEEGGGEGGTVSGRAGAFMQCSKHTVDQTIDSQTRSWKHSAQRTQRSTRSQCGERSSHAAEQRHPLGVPGCKLTSASH